ncbi:hypothetical protein GALMADRAFT_106163 [Galerina marginata CBS 339.88]|uniref:DUF6593 domain-containing protein n=1 Tax=Galerina marginata (strain CBS 339.88) TaxID=685588 RepID=A0A067SID3_GALM3|nr:hypothetical protein GALMADRAFT_106163 [Galerina marginata CBS 339.88]
MPRTFYSPEAYADELAFLNSELGYALFHPGPPGAQQPVAIGDIGTIQGGSFIRFFNAFREATDEINQTDTGTPDGFKPVAQLNQRINNNDASYSPGIFGSKGVQQMSLDAGAGFPIVAGADIRTSFRIAFNKESDVALMTKWKSKASNAVFIQPLAVYFLRNHQRFLDHIRGAHGSATIRSDELVFVTATLMTGDWVMARASTGSEEFNLGFDCNYAGIGGGHVHWNYTSTLTSVLPSREGPDRPSNFDYSVTPQFDQCIFLKRLRIFDRSVFSWLKQKLLLSTADSTEDDLQRLHLKKKISGDNDQSLFGTTTGALSLKTNLLVIYIFENSDPDLVVIHEDDIHHAIPEGTEADDVADVLATSFRHGNVFIEILSEISQEIGKRVASISTRPLPVSTPGGGETIVVDDVLNDVTASSEVLSWTNQDTRESILFNSWGILYRFKTSTAQNDHSVTTMWRTLQPNKEDCIAKLKWSPNGGLGRVEMGKQSLKMVDLARPDPSFYGERRFTGPDGLQYRWRPSTTSVDIVLQDPNNEIVAFFRPTRQTRYEMGDVYGELHFIRNAGLGTVMHPPMMDMVTLTAMLYRFCAAWNL